MSASEKKTLLSSINKRLAWKLSIIVFVGLMFSFAIAPLYDVMCREFGLNGRADSTATKFDTSQKVDKTRWVTVIFTGNTMPGLGWSFHPKQTSMRVHPGEITLTSYTAKNNAEASQLGVAVPSITPELATLYFKTAPRPVAQDADDHQQPVPEDHGSDAAADEPDATIGCDGGPVHHGR